VGRREGRKEGGRELEMLKIRRKNAMHFRIWKLTYEEL
jgi:hypothetical protein